MFSDFNAPLQPFAWLGGLGVPSWSKVGPKGASRGPFGDTLGNFGITVSIFGALLASLFPGPFPRPVFGEAVRKPCGCQGCRGAVGCCRGVQGPAAVVLWVGGGIPSEIPC